MSHAQQEYTHICVFPLWIVIAKCTIINWCQDAFSCSWVRNTKTEAFPFNSWVCLSTTVIFLPSFACHYWPFHLILPSHLCFILHPVCLLGADELKKHEHWWVNLFYMENKNEKSIHPPPTPNSCFEVRLTPEATRCPKSESTYRTAPSMTDKPDAGQLLLDSCLCWYHV